MIDKPTFDVAKTREKAFNYYGSSPVLSECLANACDRIEELQSAVNIEKAFAAHHRNRMGELLTEKRNLLKLWVAELEQEKSTNTEHDKVRVLVSESTEQQERIRKLEEALKFYARRRSYDIGIPESEEPDNVYRDNGARARAALAKDPQL